MVRMGLVGCRTRNHPTTIPPLSGVAFRKQFNTDAKIIAVIRSGSVIGRRADREHAALGRDHPR